MIVYFLIYLFIEVMVTTQFAEQFGGLALFIEILVSFGIGSFILANFKYAIVEQLNNLAFGRINQEELVSFGIFTLIGAILLILPGIFSDAVGILLQFEWFGLFLKKRLGNHLFRTNNHHTTRSEHDYIDVEIVEESEDRSGGPSLKR